MDTYYEILGLEPGASQLDIKKAYFKKIRQYSPESAPEQFQKIREAYEQLKKAQNEPEGPAFPPLSNPLAQQMYDQIQECQRTGNSKLFRDTCEEAWHRFPDDLRFLYFLIIAQRQCGNTGKAVKNAELLVGKEPDNKWFQGELAISYMERGFTQKAWHACEKAYELGYRDIDFILMYSIECNDYGEYDRGMEILREVLDHKEKWEKEDIPELMEIYAGLFRFSFSGTESHYLEILEDFCVVMDRYRLYVSEYLPLFAAVLASMSNDIRNGEAEFAATERAFGIMGRICRSDEEKEILKAAIEEYHYQRILNDPRIGDTLKDGLEIYYDLDDADYQLLKFAQTDLQLRMIEEREDILEQIIYVKYAFPDYAEKLSDFIEKLASEKNLFLLKDSLLKTYRRLEPMCGGGRYYDMYPEERKKALGTVINDGTETYRRATKKVGRNDPCPCGSGKKYKQCCMNKK